MKYFDVVAPKSKWEADYAHLEYLRGDYRRKFATTIEVLDANGCRLINGRVVHDDFCSDIDPEDE